MKTRFLIAAAVVGLSLPLAAPTVQAAPPDVNDHYSFEESNNFRDCGLRLHEDAVGGGHFKATPIVDSDGEAWLGHDNYWYHVVLTNRDTGAWLEFNGRATFKEMTGTQIEGDIWEFTAHEAGQPFVLRDSDGNVVFRDRGLLGFRGVFDLGGDGELGGELLEEEITKVAGPHPSMDADFCEVVTELIG